MFKASSWIFLLSSTVSADYSAPASEYTPHAYDSHSQPEYTSTGPYHHPPTGYNPYPPVVFPEPLPILDKNQYRDILSLFEQCKELKCVHSESSFTDIHESIAELGEYTSCVTGCAAEQIFHTIVNYKQALGDLYEIGANKLLQARKYIAEGVETFDIIGTGTRIKDSCCLPNENFVKPEEIVIPVTITATDVNGVLSSVNNNDQTIYEPTTTRMISVKKYVNLCTTNDGVFNDEEGLKIVCDPNWIKYYQLLQHNVGHLVKTPASSKTAPPKSCDEHGVENPTAQYLQYDVCRATYYIRNNFKYPVEELLIKPVIATYSQSDSCPSDHIMTEEAGSTVSIIEYERQDPENASYYVVSDGLPSQAAFDGNPSETSEELVAAIASGDYEQLTCQYNQGLATFDGVRFYTPKDPPSSSAIEAAKVCPYGGLFEYCNMQQYTSFLTKQLFDNDGCSVVDMRGDNYGFKGSAYTLSCLYKIISLKCDCMEAVLNCYEHQFSFTSALSNTIGKSASVLCGFVLCLKPSVFSLFGGKGAIEKADIMRGLLTQVGISVPSVSSMPPATFAFLAFGIGMIAFVATKMVSRKANNAITIDNGYAQLI